MHILVKTAGVIICLSSIKDGKTDKDDALLWMSPTPSFL